MPPEPKRRRALITIIVILAAIAVLVLLLLKRCQRPEPAAPTSAVAATPVAPQNPSPPSEPAVVAPAASEPEEVLTPSTLTAPAEVSAGAAFSVSWTGPNNPRDFVTLARKGAEDGAFASYRDTSGGSTLQFTAPIETGEWEMRYVAGRSQTVLGRAPLTVTAIAATLDAPPDVPLGGKIAVRWTGPNNAGDYITLVPRDTPDGQYGNYTATSEGSPLMVLAPPVAGDAELRYMTGQGGNVIGRRPVRILQPEVTLSASATAVAGSTLAVTWTGPNNPGDYITAIDRDQPEGAYGNYTHTSTGSPLALLLPITPGEVELRYMSGQGNHVLSRRALTLLPVTASLSAPADAQVGSAISVAWTGPNYAGDYLTVVPTGAPDEAYGSYANASEGSPVNLTAPATAAECEIRYVTGQGRRIIGRRAIRITP